MSDNTAGLTRLARSLAAAERAISRGEPDRIERTKEVGENIAALVPEWKDSGRISLEAVALLVSIEPALHWAQIANQQSRDDKQLFSVRGDVSAQIQSLVNYGHP